MFVAGPPRPRIWSLPTVLGLSIMIFMPVFMPDPTSRGRIPVTFSTAFRMTGVNGGTTEERMAPSMSCYINLMHLQDVLKAHRVFRVRASLVRCDPLYEICFFSSMPPMTVLVLPMSIAKIIGELLSIIGKIYDILYHGLYHRKRKKRQPEESYVKGKTVLLG